MSLGGLSVGVGRCGGCGIVLPQAGNSPPAVPGENRSALPILHFGKEQGECGGHAHTVDCRYRGGGLSSNHALHRPGSNCSQPRPELLRPLSAQSRSSDLRTSRYAAYLNLHLIHKRRTNMTKIAISVFSLAAALLLTLSPALALANCDCCDGQQQCCRQACCQHRK